VLSSLWRSLQQNKETWSFQDPAVVIIVYLWQRTDSSHSKQSALHWEAEPFSCSSRIMKTAFQETQLPLWHTARKIRHNLLHNARVIRGLASYTLQSSFPYQRTCREDCGDSIHISDFIYSQESHKNDSLELLGLQNLAGVYYFPWHFWH
jgi:hypothetical protein